LPSATTAQNRWTQAENTGNTGSYRYTSAHGDIGEAGVTSSLHIPSQFYNLFQQLDSVK
jgi:hypothetical protein